MSCRLAVCRDPSQRPTYKTRPDKCHVSHVVGDTESWEQKMAQALEDMPEVIHYVKNQNLGFFIPYAIEGQQRNYVPDFICRADDGHGKDDLLNLIVEVSGQRDPEKQAKVATAQTLWVWEHFLKLDELWETIAISSKAELSKLFLKDAPTFKNLAHFL